MGSGSLQLHPIHELGLWHAYVLAQVVKNSLEPLDCTKGSDGRKVMDDDPSIVCDTSTDSTYKYGH